MLSCCLKLLKKKKKKLVHFRGKNTYRKSFPAPETRLFQHGSCLKPHVTIGLSRQEAIVAHLAQYRGEQAAERKQHVKQEQGLEVSPQRRKTMNQFL